MGLQLCSTSAPQERIQQGFLFQVPVLSFSLCVFSLYFHCINIRHHSQQNPFYSFHMFLLLIWNKSGPFLFTSHMMPTKLNFSLTKSHSNDSKNLRGSFPLFSQCSQSCIQSINEWLCFLFHFFL